MCGLVGERGDLGSGQSEIFFFEYLGQFYRFFYGLSHSFSTKSRFCEMNGQLVIYNATCINIVIQKGFRTLK